MRTDSQRRCRGVRVGQKSIGGKEELIPSRQQAVALLENKAIELMASCQIESRRDSIRSQSCYASLMPSKYAE